MHSLPDQGWLACGLPSSPDVAVLASLAVLVFGIKKLPSVFAWLQRPIIKRSAVTSSQAVNELLFPACRFTVVDRRRKPPIRVSK